MTEKSESTAAGGRPERRRDPRFPLELPVSIEILIPEDSFTPHLFSGISVDFGLWGMSFTVSDIVEDLYHKLLTEPRTIRVAFISSLDHKEIKITGKVVGIEFRSNEDRNEPGPGDFRVFFESGKSGDTTRYMAFINSLGSKLA